MANARERLLAPGIGDDHTRWGLRGGLRLYFDTPFDQIAEPFADVFEGLWDWLERDRFKWWRNEGMSLYAPMFRHTPTGLRQVLTRGRPRDVGCFEVKATDPEAASSTIDASDALAIASLEATWFTQGGICDGDASELRLFDDEVRFEKAAEAWRDKAIELCDVLPVKSGLGGWFAEFDAMARRDFAELFGRAMRHPGVDLEHNWRPQLGGAPAIKGVGWLTILGTDLVEALGGRQSLRDALDDAVVIHAAQHGIVLQAGPTPEVGDVNRGERLPLYRDVFGAVGHLVQPLVADGMPFDMGRDDDEERTEAWLTRFSD